MNLFEFYKNKKVFITGHTGFKGSWMCKVLSMAGAKVSGYALEAPTNPNLFKLAYIEHGMDLNLLGDVRDLRNLQLAMQAIQPDIVIHMAAQPLVRESYENPVYTYATNVMGTVNFLEAVRHCPSVKSVINVTTAVSYTHLTLPTNSLV